jgi:hypothetical protein
MMTATAATTPQPIIHGFDEFDEALKLNPGERLRAERIHNEITAYLIAKGLITSAFLQGSFRRKTMIAPLRDIDKVVILHEALRGHSPHQVMDLIEQALRTQFPGAVFDRTKHSLKIDLGPGSFDFDVVPAWETTTSDDDVLIANTKPEPGEDLWVRSNTRELIRVVSQRNQDTDGKFVRQIRMGKQVVKEHLDGVIPGLHIESWAYAAVTTSMPHDEALAVILAAAADKIGGTYYEPTGVDRISERLDPSDVAKAAPVLRELARKAAEARNLSAAGDAAGTLAVWKSVCGELFPAPPSQSAGEALSRAFTGATVTSAGTVSSTAAGAQRSQPTRSWAPK